MASPWTLYQRPPSFVLGFHGTDTTVVSNVIDQPSKHLKKSESTMEWLGHGVYFWENDPERALDWAKHGKTKGHITTPAVVGAIIDLGLCLDLTTMTGLAEVEQAYRILRATSEKYGVPLSRNTGGKDRLKRELDCAVIQALHYYRVKGGLAPYDSVRAPFPEDAPLYDESGFRKKNHIQICVIHPEKCIRGYFKPIQTLKYASNRSF